MIRDRVRILYLLFLWKSPTNNDDSSLALSTRFASQGKDRSNDIRCKVCSNDSTTKSKFHTRKLVIALLTAKLLNECTSFQHNLAVIPPKCSVADWIESFNKSGLSKCGGNNLFITGFYRLNPLDNTSDPISSLERAICCNSTPEFSDQDGTCKTVYWRDSLDT